MGHVKYFLDASQGVVLEKMNIHLKKCQILPTIMPPLLEQRRIATILTDADGNIAREEAYRDKLLTMKHGLMADLITGKVQVSEKEII
ncbi:hypothetical protein [Methanogenium cariaci]|jgi:type I restriction enzyme, S subunit